MKKIKNILLIDIPTYNVKLPEYHKQLLKKRLQAQSLIIEKRLNTKIYRPWLTYSRGLLIIAASLEKNGFHVKYLNYSDPIDRKNILQYANEADCIGITVLTPTFYIVEKICKSIKEFSSNVYIILGGPHVNVRPIETLVKNKYADFAIIGEAEERLPKLLININAMSNIPGIVYRDNNKEVKQTSNNIEVISEKNLLIPAYHLLNRPITEYAHNIQIHRGCPYKCKFCFERLSKRNDNNTNINISRVIKEIKLLSSKQPNNTLFHFSDAILNINSEETRCLLYSIRKINPKLMFSFDTRVDHINEKEIKEFSESNFLFIRLGFESLHNNILNLSEKNINTELQNEACKIIRKTNRNIVIHSYMLTGLPGTTIESLISDALTIKKIILDDLVDIIGNKIMVPYPGTYYYEYAKQYSIKIRSNNWSQYDRRSFPVYSLKNLSAEEIYFGYLLQEATLVHSYFDKLRCNGISTIDIKNVTHGLDYLYANYIENLITN